MIQCSKCIKIEEKHEFTLISIKIENNSSIKFSRKKMCVYVLHYVDRGMISKIILSVKFLARTYIYKFSVFLMKHFVFGLCISRKVFHRKFQPFLHTVVSRYSFFFRYERILKSEVQLRAALAMVGRAAV